MRVSWEGWTCRKCGWGEAFELDDKKDLKLMALEDPDLKPMWEMLRME